MSISPRAFAVTLSSLSLLLLPAAAHATGGSSIAAAPNVSVGQQEFGNTADGQQVGEAFCGTDYSEYWKLDVAAGDDVTVDWEAGSYMRLLVWPVGTTDYTVEQADYQTASDLNSNYKAELTFTASVAGAMPLEFQTGCDDQPGPYDFTVNVVHRQVIATPQLAATKRHGSAVIGVHTADGSAVAGPETLTLEARVPHSSWVTIGSGTVSNGAATVAYKLPHSIRKGSAVRVRAQASGPSYTAATSATEKFRFKHR